MNTNAKRIAGLAVAAALAAPATAFATNGYFAHGYGVKSKGLAGASVALPLDSLDAAVNPANMVYVGKRYDLGITLFSPQRSYTVEGNPSGFPGTFGLAPGTVDSDSEYFLIPSFGANWMIDAKSSAGLSVYGNGGLNTDYPGFANAFCPPPGGTGTYCAGATGVNLSQLFLTGTYARKFAGDKASWGVTAIVAYQQFEAKGVGSFAPFSSSPTNLSDNGTDDSFGGGLKVGINGEVTKGLRLAGSYQSKISMGEFDKYKGLFAEQGGFDIPATWTVGLAFDVNPKSTLTFDVQQIMYSDIKAIANPLLPNLQTSQLGNTDGAGFGWEDMTIYKIGYQFATSPLWTWRVGLSTGSQPIPESEMLFNILAPAVMEEHVTFGFTRAVGTDMEFDVSAMYAPKNEVSGPNTLDAPNQQKITIEMTQWELGFNWAWKF